VTAVSEVVSAVLPSTVAFPPTVTALPLPAVVPWPTSVAVPPHLGELLGEIGVLTPKPTVRPSVKTRSRPAPARLPQPAYGVGFASAWGGSQAPVAAAAAGRRASAAAPPAHSPRPGPRRPVPVPAPGGNSPARAAARPAESQQPQSRRSSPRTFSFLRSARGACARRETVDVSGRARHGSNALVSGPSSA
jgi:hypothetical protein